MSARVLKLQKEKKNVFFLLRKAIDPFGDVILAMTMNGELLPADHGFPLRVLVPGFAGVRSCKWLAKMELVDDMWPG